MKVSDKYGIPVASIEMIEGKLTHIERWKEKSIDESSKKPIIIDRSKSTLLADRFQIVKDYFNTNTIPIKEYQPVPHEKIIDIPLFIKTNLTIVEANINKTMVIPYYERLERLYIHLFSLNNKNKKNKTTTK